MSTLKSFLYDAGLCRAPLPCADVRCPMAMRDREWPTYTQWFCCSGCDRLWTYQGSDVVVLHREYALGPAFASPGVPERICTVCENETPVSILEI